MRLQGALDNDVHIAVSRFIEAGVPATIEDLYKALQRSNSALKRKQRRTVEASIERVLDFIDASRPDTGAASDSDAAIEEAQPKSDPAADIMNRSLRANLAPRPVPNDTPIGTSADASSPRKRMTNGESHPKRLKRGNEDKQPSVSRTVSLTDLGGMGDVIAKLRKLLVMPMRFPEVYAQMNSPVAKGILLHGPPGCGKTMLAHAFAAHLSLPIVEILGPSIVSGMSGESEKGVREKFEEANRQAPCLIFIDEIDAIAPKRDTSQSQMEKRIVAQLLVSMDELGPEPLKPVIVLAATNRPDSLDPALRRGGRFGTEININVPNEITRQKILETQTRDTPIDPDVDFEKLAKMTAGFVGADLHDLVGKAVAHHMDKLEEAYCAQADLMNLPYEHAPGDEQITISNRLMARSLRPDLPMPPGFENMSLTMENFLTVLPEIVPSSKREGFSTVPDVSWKDIGALQHVREQLELAIIRPLEQPELYEAFGMTAPSGVLLWGPPGCGKTLLAKAVAAESKANFISIKGPELLNKYVGESEAAVRKVFTRARSSAPCVIFFDELDALVPRRGDASSEASARVVNTLLTELDGLSIRTGIYVIAATNLPDVIDEAMLRPGRLETPLFVDLPGDEERVDILRALVRSKPCTFTDEIADVARKAKGFSGADLGALLRKAMEGAIRRQSFVIESCDFDYAKSRIEPSVRNPGHWLKLARTFGSRG